MTAQVTNLLDRQGKFKKRHFSWVKKSYRSDGICYKPVFGWGPRLNVLFNTNAFAEQEKSDWYLRYMLGLRPSHVIGDAEKAVAATHMLRADPKICYMDASLLGALIEARASHEVLMRQWGAEAKKWGLAQSDQPCVYDTDYVVSAIPIGKKDADYMAMHAVRAKASHPDLSFCLLVYGRFLEDSQPGRFAIPRLFEERTAEKELRREKVRYKGNLVSLDKLAN